MVEIHCHESTVPLYYIYIIYLLVIIGTHVRLSVGGWVISVRCAYYFINNNNTLCILYLYMILYGVPRCRCRGYSARLLSRKKIRVENEIDHRTRRVFVFGRYKSAGSSTRMTTDPNRERFCVQNAYDEFEKRSRLVFNALCAFYTL